MTGSSGALSAVRLALDPGPPLDPFALAGDEGIIFRSGDLVLVGLGIAATIPLVEGLESTPGLEAAARSVAAVTLDDRYPQSVAGVVAFGALPFGRSEAASLVIPELIYGADGVGNEWMTAIAATRADLPSDSSGLRQRLALQATAEPVGTGHCR